MKPPRLLFLCRISTLSAMSSSTASSSLPLTTAPHTALQSTKPKKPQPTHFLCIPLHNATSQLTHTLSNLRDDLIVNYELIPPTSIRPVITMHLTLGVMSLPSRELIQRAKNLVETGVDFGQLLRSLSPTTAAGAKVQPLVICLRGLESMGPRKRTSVLYAVPCDETRRLRAFAEAVRGRFEREGLMIEEGRELKLHATVVNTIYSTGGRGRGGGGQARGGGSRGRGRGGGGGARNERLTFDAGDLVDKYRGVPFAEGVRLDKVAVWRMGEVRREDGTSEGYLPLGEKSF